MTERRLRGIGVSPGTALAPAIVVRFEFPEVTDRSIGPDEVEAEIARLRQAIAEVSAELEDLRGKVLERAGPEESGIFDAQILMVQDPDFLAGVEFLIRKNLLSAETAFEFKALEARELWAGTGSSILRERLTDLTATHRRVLHRLTGRQDPEWWAGDLGGEVIIVARELSPGLTVQLDREHVVGLVSEEGTRTSHAAILAHSLGIPAVMGVTGALDRIRSGATVLLDGLSGRLILDPTPDEIYQAQALSSRRHRLDLELETAASGPTVTPDGHPLAVLANVDLPEELDAALRHGAEGVGLLRTEFLVTGRTEVPTEDEQAEYFARVAEAFRPGPVVIRTFDLGGDKFPSAFRTSPEPNPFLGWRSIRVCLDEPEIFRPQLRAILRAARGRNVRLMLPLVTTVEEVRAVRALLVEERAELARRGQPAVDELPVGVMIETPAAVILADRLAAECDFFSVGTNDLTQYTLAVDRGNARLAARFQPHHPAVLAQLRHVLDVGHARGLEVSLCGEMASEPLWAILLAGLGFRTLSVAPPSLPLIKWVLRTVPLAAAREGAARALALDTAAEVEATLLEVTRAHIDLRLLGLRDALPGERGGASLRERSAPDS
ncbi:MAG TPA: phosphoenolpyruvate--protein phosphotransferase [Gemmatimonadales bacterium]|nr:phosphoenolpyruvate--protein phosphotransferase [Gemmatimonadales bacterium]